MRFCQIFYICLRNIFDKKDLLNIIGIREYEKIMPFVCDPPNTVPPAVVQLADKYDYSCAQKIKPIQNIGDYDVYGVYKYNFFRSYILLKNNNVRFASNNEAEKISYSCLYFQPHYKCTPMNIINNEVHYIEGF